MKRKPAPSRLSSSSLKSPTISDATSFTMMHERATSTPDTPDTDEAADSVGHTAAQTAAQHKEKQHKEEYCGTVAVMGLTNAGKSTLINQLLGKQVSIVHHKAQTTRSTIRAVMTEDTTQAIIMDLPGLHNVHLPRAAVKTIDHRVSEANVVLVLVDAQALTSPLPNANAPLPHFMFHDPRQTRNLESLVPARWLHLAQVIERLKVAQPDGQIMLVLNKIDMVKPRTLLLEVAQQLERLITWSPSSPSSPSSRKSLDYSAHLAHARHHDGRHDADIPPKVGTPPSVGTLPRVETPPRVGTPPSDDISDEDDLDVLDENDEDDADDEDNANDVNDADARDPKDRTIKLAGVYMVAAKNGDGVATLRRDILRAMPLGAWRVGSATNVANVAGDTQRRENPSSSPQSDTYQGSQHQHRAPNALTTSSSSSSEPWSWQLAADLTRKACLDFLHQEVPYHVHVVHVGWEREWLPMRSTLYHPRASIGASKRPDIERSSIERSSGVSSVAHPRKTSIEPISRQPRLHIQQSLVVDHPRYKRTILGHQGRLIGQIRERAEIMIARQFQIPVRLSLHIVHDARGLERVWSETQNRDPPRR